MTSTVAPRAAGPRRPAWRLPTALLLLAAVPLIAGAVRLAEILTGADVTPANERFLDSPVPIVAHIVSVTVYAVLGVFQFVPAVRRRRPRWHRRAGRVLVVAGFVVAGSGLWMTLCYDVPDVDGVAVFVMRVLVSTAMAVCLALGLAAILARDVGAHRAWMIRAYALAMGAGTQVLTHLPAAVTGSEPGVTGRAVAMGAGWGINVVVAEWVIRRGRPGATRSGRVPRSHYRGQQVAPEEESEMARKKKGVVAAAAAFAASPAGRRLIAQAKAYASRPETKAKARELMTQAKNRRKGGSSSADLPTRTSSYR